MQVFDNGRIMIWTPESRDSVIKGVACVNPARGAEINELYKSRPLPILTSKAIGEEAVAGWFCNAITSDERTQSVAEALSCLEHAGIDLEFVPDVDEVSPAAQPIRPPKPEAARKPVILIGGSVLGGQPALAA